MKLNKFKFFVLVKDPCTGDTDHYDVMQCLYSTIFTSNGKLSKKNFFIYEEKTFKRKEIKTKQDLRRFVDSHFKYHYWAKCEWEFIMRDWPTGRDERDRKVDVYEQLRPNIDLIVNLLWDQLQDKL